MKKWTLLYKVGQFLDKVFLGVAVVGVVVGIVGLLIGATWTSSVWYTVLYIVLGSLSWFVFTLLFLFKKVKEER